MLNCLVLPRQPSLARRPIARTACTIAWLVLGLAGTAHAGRPLATEDAGVLASGECEWESLAANVKTPGAATAHGLGTQVACGTPWHTQLAVNASSARADGATATTFGVNGKTRLTRTDDASPQWTLAYGLSRTRLPAGGGNDSVGFVNLVATASPSEGWTVHANLGALRSSLAHASTTTWALAAERALGGGVDLGAEVYGDDRTEPWLGLGLRWTITPHLSVNGSVARQGGSEGQRLITVGFKLAF